MATSDKVLAERLAGLVPVVYSNPMDCLKAFMNDPSLPIADRMAAAGMMLDKQLSFEKLRLQKGRLEHWKQRRADNQEKRKQDRIQELVKLELWFTEQAEKALRKLPKAYPNKPNDDRVLLLGYMVFTPSEFIEWELRNLKHQYHLKLRKAEISLENNPLASMIENQF